MAVATQVFPIETGSQPGDIVVLGGPDLDRVLLSFIAHLSLTLDRHRPFSKFALKRRTTLSFKFLEDALDLWELLGFELDDEGTRRIEAGIGQQHAKRGKITGFGRHD